MTEIQLTNQVDSFFILFLFPKGLGNLECDLFFVFVFQRPYTDTLQTGLTSVIVHSDCTKDMLKPLGEEIRNFYILMDFTLPSGL